MIVFRPIIRPFFKLLSPLWQWLYKRSSSKAQNWQYKGQTYHIPIGVFHPKWFFSSQLLVKHLRSLPLKNKPIIEVGSGSGFVAINAAKQGASVTAIDVNPNAVKATIQNAKSNNVNLHSIESNLFDNVPPQQFDYIVVNPPFYPKQAQNPSEQAWFCGENFEYFQKLFSQSPQYLSKSGQLIMILSQDCDTQTILKIAEDYYFIQQSKPIKYDSWLEINWVFTLICKA